MSAAIDLLSSPAASMEEASTPANADYAARLLTSPSRRPAQLGCRSDCITRTSLLAALTATASRGRCGRLHGTSGGAALCRRWGEPAPARNNGATSINVHRQPARCASSHTTCQIGFSVFSAERRGASCTTP
jgi:hypothetical protein